MKRFLFIFLIGLLIFGTQPTVFAQEPNVDKALQETKTSLDNLVTAKDENSPLDLALRISTFQKVIDLALSEAKDLKIKLLAIDNISDKDIRVWKEAMVDTLNTALTHYEEQRAQLTAEEGALTLEDVQQLAQSFKAWRAEHYEPAAVQTQDFLLLIKEDQALEIVQRRYDRIQKDVSLLSRAGYSVQQLSSLLKQANAALSSAVSKNGTAYDLFITTYVTPPVEVIDADTATSTVSTSTATPTVEALALTTLETVSSTATSSPEAATSTLPTTPGLGETPEEPSIRDVVQSSFEDIKQTYQVFIEMSDLVRQLLK